MTKKMRRGFLLFGVSLALVFGTALVLRDQHHQTQQRYDRMAWQLRRPGDARIQGARARFLDGKFVEALRLLKKADTADERELRRVALRCFLYDLPWPQQVLLTHQVGALNGQRMRIFARVVQSGYANEMDRVRLDLMVWNGERTTPLTLKALFASGVKESGEEDRSWAHIEGLKTAYLERKDSRDSQLWVLGRTRSGKNRLEIYYGSQQWKRWVWLGDKVPRLEKDRVSIPGGADYKLVDNEWVTVP